MRKQFGYFLLLSICMTELSLGMPVAHAAAAAYDRYGATYRQPQIDEPIAKNILNNFLTYPFEIVRWPVRKSLVYIEKHHVDDKIKWGYDTLVDHGVKPHLNIFNPVDGDHGVEFDFIRMVNQKSRFPDAILQSWMFYDRDVRFETGARLGMERIGGTGLRALTEINYATRYKERFYGIGPDTSRGDGYVYGLETTTVKAVLGYRPDPRWDASIYTLYENNNVDGGKDGGSGQIGEGLFSVARTPGIGGQSIFAVGSDLSFDTRNYKSNATKGGLYRVGVQTNWGLNESGGSEAGWIKLDGEASRYIPLWSDRRTLVLRTYAEHNAEIGNDFVPFYKMAKLGGYGDRPHLGETLRGFDANRFTDESAVLFNAEYRYAILQYREFRLDTALFFDQGQVFGELSEFQLKDFRESYGLGLRLSFANVVLLSTEVAFGEEGPNFYVKTTMPF